VNADLWFGAVTTLAGAALGGAISYLLSRQQIKEARAQRLETERWDQARRSTERRIEAYKDFLTHARQFRNAVRPPHHPGSSFRIPVRDIDDLARAADAAGMVVFLVNESLRTQEACANAMRTIGSVVGTVHEFSGKPNVQRLDRANDEMARVLRDFQEAARDELGASESVIRKADSSKQP
jgi:hypothetical protein